MSVTRALLIFARCRSRSNSLTCCWRSTDLPCEECWTVDSPGRCLETWTFLTEKLGTSKREHEALESARNITLWVCVTRHGLRHESARTAVNSFLFTCVHRLRMRLLVPASADAQLEKSGRVSSRAFPSLSVGAVQGCRQVSKTSKSLNHRRCGGRPACCR
jgi:hypothetical protein